MKVSIIIPMHFMENWQFFLDRALRSIEAQSFTDYEIIITKNGKMAENTNSGIRKAQGELIKILFMDDYFAHPDALKNIVEAMGNSHWLVTGCLHQRDGEQPHSPHYPVYSNLVKQGQNTIGSPSVLTIRNKNPLLFDEKMSWLLDCDLYARYYNEFGSPTILNDLNVVIGLGDHQMTHILTKEQKMEEVRYLNHKIQEPA